MIYVVLDLSAAFDTIDHSLLLSILQRKLGIQGDALNWLKSYLNNRHQCFKVKDAYSSERTLVRGVPQGSILGPILFSCYLTPLSELLSSLEVSFHIYADDTSVYFAVNDSVTPQSFSIFFGTIRKFFDSMKLKLNAEKTEFVHMRNRRQRSTLR